jgi:putative flippase GtrA
VNKLKKELRRFLIAGLTAVGTDFITYYIILNFLHRDIDIAKTLSFILGTVVAFVVNKYWTFERYEKSYKQIFQFTILYSTTLFVNVMANRLILDFAELFFLAFLIATGASTILNFAGQKWWVFK